MTAVVNGLRPVIPVNCPPGLARLMRACWDTNPDLRPSFPEVNLLLKDQYLLSAIDEDDYSYSDPPPAPPPSSSSSPGQRRSSRDDMLFAPGSQRNMNYGTYHAPPGDQDDVDGDDGETDTLLHRDDVESDGDAVTAAGGGSVNPTRR